MRKLTLGKDAALTFEAPVLIMGNLKIWSNVKMGAYTYLQSGRIRTLKSIGRYCSIAPNVTIGDLNHPSDWLSSSSFQYAKKRFSWYDQSIAEVAVPMTKNMVLKIRKTPPVIGNDVWMGANVTIMRGVKIGNGAIIGAGAIVTRDVKDYEIVGGVPAKHIRFRFPEEVRERLLKIQWWNYNCRDFKGIDFTNIHNAMDELEARIDNGGLQPMIPLWQTHRSKSKRSKRDPSETLPAAAGLRERVAMVCASGVVGRVLSRSRK